MPDDDAGTLVPLSPQAVGSVSVEWHTTDHGDRLGYSLTVEGEATDRRWLAGALLQLAASIAAQPWDWTEGEPDDDDPESSDALKFPVTPGAAADGATGDDGGDHA